MVGDEETVPLGAQRVGYRKPEGREIIEEWDGRDSIDTESW